MLMSESERARLLRQAILDIVIDTINHLLTIQRKPQADVGISVLTTNHYSNILK